MIENWNNRTILSATLRKKGHDLMIAPVVYLFFSGIVISALILFFDGHRGINRYFSAFIFLTSFFTYLKYSFLYSDQVSVVALFLGSFWATYFLIGPMAYFYVRGMLLDNRTLKRWDYLHFLPFAIMFLGTLPYTLNTGFEEKKEVAALILSGNWQGYRDLRINKFVPTHVNELIKGIHGLVYSIWLVCLLMHNRHRLLRDLSNHGNGRVIRTWLLLFTLLFWVLACMHAAGCFIYFKYLDKAILIDFTVFYGTIFTFCFVGFLVALLFFPGILYGLPDFAASGQGTLPKKSAISLKTVLLEEQVAEAEEKVERQEDFFSEANLLKIEYALSQWVTEKKYLEKDITLAILSQALDIPRHHLSYYFNYVLKDSGSRFRKKHHLKLF